MVEDTTLTAVYHVTGLNPTRTTQHGPKNLDTLSKLVKYEANRKYYHWRNDRDNINWAKDATPEELPIVHFAYYLRTEEESAELIIIASAQAKANWSWKHLATNAQDYIHRSFKEVIESYQKGSSERLKVLSNCETSSIEINDYQIMEMLGLLPKKRTN